MRGKASRSSITKETKGLRYRAAGDFNFTAEQVIALLIAYRNGALGWRESVRWEEVDI